MVCCNLFFIVYEFGLHQLSGVWFHLLKFSSGSRIFRGGEAANSQVGVLASFFAENCMKMKELGPGGGCVPGAPLDPPMTLRSHA